MNQRELQRKAQQKRLVNEEIQMLNYYRAPLAGNDPPDGSFFMRAYLRGWDAGVRAAKAGQAAVPDPKEEA